MTPKEMWGTDECGVCGEHLKVTDQDIAEMVGPVWKEGTVNGVYTELRDGKPWILTDEHLIVHHLCGESRGMALA